jgi:outer membrane murein-binding lipoprotein Lpp
MKKKKKMILITYAALLSGAISIGCNNSAQKVENAEEKVEEANRNLEKAKEDYEKDIENFRQITAAKIEENNKSIAEFNARKEAEKTTLHTNYKVEIENLESKNSDMKKTMDDFRAGGKEDWERFKIEFTRNMEQLAAAIQGFVNKESNKK